MSTTYEAMVFNSTIEEMRERMARKNALLSVITESQRSTIYSNVTQIASIIRGNTVEQNRILFPIGDQIIINWKDMDDPEHDTDETAYQVALDIVHHDNVELQTGEIVPGMFVQWHKCTPYGVQFSNYQAFMNCSEGLAAGTYTVSFAQTWGRAIAQPYNFTLTQAVPAGGRLSGFERGWEVAPETYTVKSWASPADASPIETVAVSIGAAGTDLGTMPYNQLINGVINTMHCVMDGYQRWVTSAVRQYLNKSGLNWFASVYNFDIRPNEHAKHGFMSGFNQDFMDAIRPIKVTTVYQRLSDSAYDLDVTFDRFFLPSLEQINATPQFVGLEGSFFEYWRSRLGISGFSLHAPTRYSGYKIASINADAFQEVCLRSINTNNFFCTKYVDIYGRIYSNLYACNVSRFTPVCVIC